MNNCRITCGDAAEYYGKKRRILRFVASRKKGGAAYNKLHFVFKAVLKRQCRKSRQVFLNALFAYFFSSNLANRVFSLTENDRIAQKYEPLDGELLYHWTKLENLEKIRTEGIIPAKNFKFVYMTDNPEYIGNSDYFYRKVMFSKKDAVFVLLKINAKDLSKEYDIFGVFDCFEYAVEKIPPQYVIFE